MSHIADGVGRGLIALVSVASLFLQRRRAALRAAAGSGALAPEAGAPVTEREDARYVRICEELLHGAGFPEQSRFRVAAVISYVSTSGRHEHAVGINVESTVISGSLCAERVALSQVIMAGFQSIRGIYLACSGPDAITPGVLCREFLIDVADPSTRVVCVDVARGGALSVYTLGELYPLWPLFRGVPREQLLGAAVEFAAGLEWQDLPSELAALCQRVCDATRGDSHDALHPMRFAAGALLADGGIVVAAGCKLVEYGCCVDPVIKLAAALEAAQAAGKEPVCLVQCDQFGILHAPFAQGRAYLNENGFEGITILVHGRRGELVRATAAELVPMGPTASGLLACD